MGALTSCRVRTVARFNHQKRYRLFDQIRNNLTRPAEQIAADHLASLQNVVTHAYTTTIGYRRLFDQVGFTPSQLQRPEDIQRIPIVTKRDFQTHPQDFQSNIVDPGQCQKKSTSGSTGTPFTFYRDWDYLELGHAGTMRCMAVAGWEPGEALGIIWGYEKEVENSLNRFKQWAKQTYLLNAFKQTETLMSQWADFLLRRRIRYLYGYPSSLHQFAEFLLRCQRSLPLRAVFCTAEKYFDFERKSIERAFACKSFDLYGSSEVQNVAFECTRGRMHIALDFVRLEQEQLRTHEPPSLVVTSLHNSVQPFIRYDLGDFGRVLADRCNCGINTPLMEILGGSKYDFLLTPAGPLHSAVLERIFNKITSIRRYQIIQHALHDYTIRCELEASASDETRRQIEMTAHTVLLEIVRQTPTIQFEYPTAITSGPNGKYRFIYRSPRNPQ
ncbi:MAG: hypothetical protein PCFJNLEI_01865 [Verrucomicrobiae bacterium]|nr:hypothetical protein [Verrucomicrobiae bacterium]